MTDGAERLRTVSNGKVGSGPHAWPLRLARGSTLSTRHGPTRASAFVRRPTKRRSGGSSPKKTAPRTVFGDSAYGTGELREHLAAAGHETVIKPPVFRPAIPGGFSIDDLDIDTAAGTVTCAAGHTVTIRAWGTASFARHCQRCPLRRRCTNARTGRVIKVHPDDDRLHDARRQAMSPEFWATYTTTRPIGGTVHRLARRRRLPESPLPAARTHSALARAALRSRQPETPRHLRPRTRRPPLDPRCHLTVGPGGRAKSGPHRRASSPTRTTGFTPSITDPSVGHAPGNPLNRPGIGDCSNP